jgi:hypothetical protein
MNSKVMCSWCCAMVDAGTKTCPHCGHRADLPRLECDCLKCKITKSTIFRIEPRKHPVPKE